MRFLVSIQHYKRSYGATVPDLPGCVAIGDSLEEACSLISEAIGLHIEAMRRHGEHIPKPTKKTSVKIDELEEGELLTWVEVVENRGKSKAKAADAQKGAKPRRKVSRRPRVASAQR